MSPFVYLGCVRRSLQSRAPALRSSRLPMPVLLLGYFSLYVSCEYELKYCEPIEAAQNSEEDGPVGLAEDHYTKRMKTILKIVQIQAREYLEKHLVKLPRIISAVHYLKNWFFSVVALSEQKCEPWEICILGSPWRKVKLSARNVNKSETRCKAQ